MHSVTVRKEIVDRVLQRRGRYHLFDWLNPARTVLVAIDMQSALACDGVRRLCSVEDQENSAPFAFCR
jgi:ureidoacrylate peracid hydrolase